MRIIPLPLLFAFCCFEAVSPSVLLSSSPLPHRGLYTLGGITDEDAQERPFLTGGRILVQWADLEVGEGVYDFSKLEQALAAHDRLGRMTTVQVNGARKPRWLYEKVAVLPGPRIAIFDTEGALQYWDPIYIDAYLKFIDAFGKFLRESPHRGIVLGIRQNFNAVGTEHGQFKDDAEEDIASWRPAPNGHIFRESWKPEHWIDYKKKVVQAHIDALTPDFTLFIRNNVFVEDVLTDQQKKMLEEGRIGLFHTSSEQQPRMTRTGKSNAVQYEAFLRYCRTGKAPGYAEPWGPSDSNKLSAPHFPPHQFNYWRLLLDLHCGVSFIALKPDDIARADEEPEFRGAFDFASRYAGYHASPEVSPGAWVAFREGDTIKGDYNFLMNRLNSSSDTPVNHQGPEDQRFGPWGRAVDGNGKIDLVLDPVFRKSLRNCAVRVVYLDRGTGSFTVSINPKADEIVHQVKKENSGRWREAEFEVPAAAFAGIKDGSNIRLTSDGSTVFHMVEVMRRDAQ